MIKIPFSFDRICSVSLCWGKEYGTLLAILHLPCISRLANPKAHIEPPLSTQLSKEHRKNYRFINPFRHQAP